MATIRGYATPTSWKVFDEPIGDHTWVASDETGVCWPCLGGTKGYYCKASRWKDGRYVPPEGHEICAGSGSVDEAKCMGRPKETTFKGVPASAGITYGINGVCHQIANRVLYGSGQTVKEAKRYWFSVAHFGTYGTRVPPEALHIPILKWVALAVDLIVAVEWDKRTSRCPLKNTAPSAAPQGLLGEVREIHSRHVQSASLTRAAMTEIHLQEVTAIYRHRLGDHFDSNQIEQVKDLILSRETELPEAGGKDMPEATGFVPSDAETIAEAYNDAVTGFYGEVAKILGSDKYIQVFDAPPEQPVMLIDPEILGKGHS